MIREKIHRLNTSLYQGHHAIAFTCCIDRRQECFKVKETVDAIAHIFLDSLAKYEVNAHVYLFMPDHLHLLVEGAAERSSIYECMVHFKQRSGFWLSKNIDLRWQKDFYDHILRKDEEIEKHVRYILENPMRKGIVENWKIYPYKGSTVYNFNQW